MIGRRRLVADVVAVNEVSKTGRTIAQLAALVGATLEIPQGLDASRVVTGLNTVDRAIEGELTFVGSVKFARLLHATKALAAVVSNDVEIPAGNQHFITLRVKSADHAMITILELFADPEWLPPVGVDPSARIDASASIAPGVRIGPFVSVGANAVIGAGTALYSGVVIYQSVRLGDNCVLHSNSTVRERCVLGSRVILSSGVVIGTDGFGYRPTNDGSGMAKVPHIGNVVIDDDVEIGANSCVDRGKFGATRIGAGSKIDNLCQIGHNVEIGRLVVISGHTGIAGSTRIGDGCRIGGGCGISDHLVIGKGASLAARSGVMGDVPDGASWGGYPAQEFRQALREMAVIRKLPEWQRQLTQLLGPQKAP